MPLSEVPAPDLREWLEADGLGGFANGTISGTRTRRYHALLLVATLPPAARVALVNGFEAQVEYPDGSRIPLFGQRYTPGVTSPEPTARIAAFTLDPWPSWTYDLPQGKLLQEIFVPQGHAAAVVRWTWTGAGKALRLRVRPFFSGRDFHALQHENDAFGFLPVVTPGGNLWHSYEGMPDVLVHSNGTYEHEPCWYRNFLYDEEQARGYDCVEDLAAPGLYQFAVGATPAVLIFSAAGLGVPLPAGAPDQIATALAHAERTRRGVFTSPHLRAADAYLVARDTGRTIIAGYPWFGDWGRDTFISLRGLCLATGRLAEAAAILTAWAGAVSEGMLPNRFPDAGTAPEYNSVDASLWYVIAVFEFLEAAKDRPELLGGEAALRSAVEAILTGYECGTRFRIQADADGLLACGVPGVQLTWMDAKTGDWVVTPRIGKPVEIQALWLNALHLAADGDSRRQALLDRGRASFASRFWNDDLGCLYDVVDVDHEPGKVDASVRPNQLFACGGLPLSLVDAERTRRILQRVEDELWTPMGPRSLSPNDPHYAAYYSGSLLERDGAYHQGTVWPWLAGPFVEAWVRLRGSTAEAQAKARARFLAPRLMNLDLIGLQHLPEIADATFPHVARGCPFQAWSLGELLRLDLRVLA